MKIKLNFPNFNINVASKPKARPKRAYTRKVSRRCYATIIVEEGQVKARVSLLNDVENPDYIVINLTRDSYDLKGKKYVYTRKLYEHNKPILVRRDYETSLLRPGLASQYTPFKHGILVAGRVIKMDDELLFDYETFVASSENGVHLVLVNVDASKPLFNDYTNKQN